MKAKKPLILASALVALLTVVHAPHLNAQCTDPSTISIDQHNLGEYINTVRKNVNNL